MFCFFIMDKSKGESSLENSYPQDSYLEDYYKTFPEIGEMIRNYK